MSVGFYDRAPLEDLAEDGLKRPGEDEPMLTRLAYRSLQSLLVTFCLFITVFATDLRAEDDLRAMVNALGEAIDGRTAPPSGR